MGLKKKPGWKAARTAQAVHPVRVKNYFFFLAAFFLAFFLAATLAHLRSRVGGSWSEGVSLR
jgi:hypothetical protein